MDTSSLIVYLETEDFYKDISKDVETRFDTSNYGWDRPLPKQKNKKVIILMKDKLGEKITEFATSRPTMHSYLTDTKNENKKAKGTKKCFIKQELKYEDCKYCLESTQLEKKINQLEKQEAWRG